MTRNQINWTMFFDRYSHIKHVAGAHHDGYSAQRGMGLIGDDIKVSLFRSP